MRFILSTTIPSNKRMGTIPNILLTATEARDGCHLLMDSGSDSFVAGKHAYVDEIIEGFTVSAQSFDDNAPPVNDLKVVNAIYAYDNPNTGLVILLHVNHCIFMGNNKIDAIACPNQMRSHGVHIDERPSTLFTDEPDTQCIIADGV